MQLGYCNTVYLLYFTCTSLQLADAMELMLLSVLAPAVKCQWSLTTAEEAGITSVSD